jgi:hypothetical protein
MAELTDTAGEEIDFDPADVTAITSTDSDTGGELTCLYGLSAGLVRTAEPVATLIGRLRLEAKLAQLTRPDGSPVWIAGAAVISLRPPIQDQYPPSVQAVVSVTGLTQGVTETPAQAKAAIDAHGGRL